MTQTETTDAELVARCLASKEAFAELYARHAPPVFAFLRSFQRGDDDAASDLLQETFLRAYRALGTFDQSRPLRPWLLTIASRASQDHRKKTKRVEARDPTALGDVAGAQKGAEAERRAEVKDELDAIVKAADGLEARSLAAFLLARGQGLSYEEIARAHDCSIATVKRDLREALAALSGAARRLGMVET